MNFEVELTIDVTSKRGNVKGPMAPLRQLKFFNFDYTFYWIIIITSITFLQLSEKKI